MLKIVIYDSGYGGELFADQLEAELPVVEVIRMIDWRNSEKVLRGPKSARQTALEALRPYIGRVDLIILANHLLAATSLKYFVRKYKNQQFIGLKLPEVNTFLARPTAILTTKALAKTLSYKNYLFKLGRKTDTFCLDQWLPLIDDGELTNRMIHRELDKFYLKNKCKPAEVILACSHFNDIIPNLREVIGKNIKVYDSFYDTIRDVCRILKIRGGTGRRNH
jgi:glutamate racemase